jgi:uncharacterized protein RhaS with RHS repeats
LTQVGAITYTWDDNGNLLSDGTNTYAYDYANRLKSITGTSLAASYAYNGLGDRLRETVNGAVVLAWAYDPYGVTQFEQSPATLSAIRFLIGPLGAVLLFSAIAMAGSTR